MTLYISTGFIITLEVILVEYRIGEIAKTCNVNKKTIRYYERIGLISEPTRTDSGYRLYSDETVNRILFIKRIQDLGFTLTEI